MPSNESLVEELKKLAELHASGVLNDAEFGVAKERVLSHHNDAQGGDASTTGGSAPPAAGAPSGPGASQEPRPASPPPPTSLSPDAPQDEAADQSHSSLPSPRSGTSDEPARPAISQSADAEVQAPGEADDANAFPVSTGPTSTQIKRFVIGVVLGSVVLLGLLALYDVLSRSGVDTEASSRGVTVSTVRPGEEDDFQCVVLGALHAENNSGGPVSVHAEFGLYEDGRLIEVQSGTWDLRADFRGWLQGLDWPEGIWAQYDELSCGIADFEVRSRG